MLNVLRMYLAEEMTDRKNYTAKDPNIIEFDESIFDSVDLSRSAFQRNLHDAAIEARDFTQTMVTNTLPDPISFIVIYGCSYDGNPLVGDERTFPDDYDENPISTTSADHVTDCLWRDGFVPEWINVTVDHEDGEFTHIKLECCGRYSATPTMMYHVHEGRPPFHVLGPKLPPGYELESGLKFNLYWQEEPNNHQAKLHYDEALLREALFGFWWRTVTGRLLVAMVVCIAGFVYFWVSGDRSWIIGAFGAALLFGVGMIAAVFFVHSANMKRKFRDMGSPEATFTAFESSFSVASGAGSSTIPWSSVTEVWKLKRCWLLLFSRAQFITLPLASVPEEMRTFILQRIADAGGRTDS